jgi:hypothetical protein
MRTYLWMVAFAAALLPVAAAASPGASGSLLQNPSFLLPFVNVTPTAAVATEVAAPPTLVLATPFAGGVGYRPRSDRSRGSVMPMTTQVHVGFLDPTDGLSTGFMGGFRMGPQVDPRVQIGLGMDWWHASDLVTGPLPGGHSPEQFVLHRTGADLLPVLAFVQVSGDENMRVIPYGGFGVGYEWLFVTDNDYVNNVSLERTFGGLGWQVWGGAGLPLGGRARINGEVFYNSSEVGSDTDVFVDGFGAATVRDVRNMNGLGMRFGVAWGF